MIPPTKDQLLAAIAKTEQLVPAPRTLGRALRLLRNADSALHEIADLISRDSALAVDVLRCANSAYYGRRTRIAAIAEAMQVIGFYETIRLVSLVAIHHTTNRDLESYGIAADDYWAESLFNGLFLESLARHTGAVETGAAYTAGLLRFIGRLAINQALQDLASELVWNRTTPLPDWERENVGLTQAEVGAQLLRKWQFFEPIVRAVEAQDQPVLHAGASTEPLTQALHFVAHVLPSGRGFSSADSAVEPLAACPVDHPFVTAHGLTDDAVAAIRLEANQGFLAIRENLYH